MHLRDFISLSIITRCSFYEGRSQTLGVFLQRPYLYYHLLYYLLEGELPPKPVAPDGLLLPPKFEEEPEEPPKLPLDGTL